MALTGASLLDRERELALIVQLVESATDGEFRFAVVEGPAGAGKSALLSVLAEDAVGADLRVLRATGLELEREYPFGVVRQLFEPAVHALDPLERDEVFSGVAALAKELLTGREAPSGPTPADAGFALAHSFYWMVVGLSDLGPLALVVDDVQWADLQSLRVLAFVLRRAQELPLLVALARRVSADRWESDALSAVLSRPATVIRPAPLSGHAIGLLLGDALKRDVEDDVVAEAEQLTEGNPLFVRELADSLSAAGESAAENPMSAMRGAAPAAVGRRAQRTLAGLDDDARAMAKAGAMLGEEVPLQRAAAMAELPRERASRAADALASAGILTVGEPLRFRHPLVREAVLESIEPRARALAHAHAARLVIAASEPPELAAVHLLQSDPAGDPEVVSTLRAAARRAIDAAAPELAIEALRRALREPPQPSDRPVVLKELAMVEARTGDSATIEHFEEAFRSDDSLERVADGLGAYASLLMNVHHRFDEGMALIDRVIGAVGDRERRLTLEAEVYAFGYTVPMAGERLARVTEGMTGESPIERLLLAWRACHEVHAGKMNVADAAPVLAAVMKEEVLLGRFGPDSPIYIRMLVELASLQEYDWAGRELDAAIAEARRRSAWFGLTVASMMRSVVANIRGELLKAEAHARTAVEIATQMGWLAGAPSPLVALIKTLSVRGDFREAERLLDEYNFRGPLPDGLGYYELLDARGRLWLYEGHPEQAIEDLQELRTRLDRTGDISQRWADLASGLVPALVQVGRAEEAREVAEVALSHAQASGIPRSIADGLRACALANADGPNVDQLEEAAAIYERIGARVILARTLVDIGAALRRRRQPAAAREPLRRALDLARACGARPVAERAEHELRAAGARPRRDRITGRDALTATEQRVAHLAIEGMTNRQIAEALFVTKKTVESHLAHVFQKLGIHARSELQRALGAAGELS